MGTGNLSNQNIPVKILDNGCRNVSTGERHTLILKSDDTLWGMGRNDMGQLGNGVYDPHIHTESTRQLHPQKLVDFKVKMIATGKHSSFFIDMNNTLWSFGQNTDGRLGTGDAKDSPFPVKTSHKNVLSIACGLSHSIILKLDGSVWSFGSNEKGQLGIGENNGSQTARKIFESGVRKLAVGNYNSYFLMDDGTLLGCGTNGDGQLGQYSADNYLLLW